MISARELSYLINEYYRIPGNEAGGNCHIVLDDKNINNSSIEFCKLECIKNNDIYGEIIMNHFLTLRKTARLKAINMADK